MSVEPLRLIVRMEKKMATKCYFATAPYQGLKARNYKPQHGKMYFNYIAKCLQHMLPKYVLDMLKVFH